MKHTTIIDEGRDEEVVIYARRRTKDIEALEAYVEQMSTDLIGYGESGEIVRLRPADVICFFVDDGKVFALTESERLTVRLPLYAVEDMLDESFVKINQSCIGNIRKIDRFHTSIGGSLMVIFHGGHRDYVSRRQLKTVKERIGFRL